METIATFLVFFFFPRAHMSGCKHGKVDPKILWYIETINFLGQRPKSNRKALFELGLFS